MGKISSYARVLVSKLTDVFACDQTDNGTTETKSATVEQIGTAIGTLQNFADLDTSNKNLVDAINEIASYTPVYGNTASGAIATFDTSLALPLQDCTIGINAVQEGSGTPSPQNVRNLVGFTGANIKQFGANLISGDTYQLGVNVVLLGESAGDTYSTYLKATTYTISFTRPTSKTFRLDLTDSNGVQTRLINAGTATRKTFTIETEGFYKFGTYMSGGMTASDIADVMLVGGSSVKPYTAYTTPTTTAISWNDLGTVSEGSLDVTTGKLTVVNGSMGAGDYQITPIPINQISGTNNIFCDTGDTSVVYACSLKDYIDSQ